MSTVPENLRYSKEHEWVRLEGDIAIIGITDYAQASLGDITYVELPEVGEQLQAGDTFGVVESVKAASDLYIPLSGEVVERNESLDDQPELVNSAAFSDGWMLRLRVEDQSQLDDLLTAEAYRTLIEED